MSEELKPCPCGLPIIGYRYIPGKTDRYWLQCECGWEGPVRETRAEAIAAWNQRAKPVVKALQWEQEPDLPRLWDADGMGLLYRVLKRYDGTASLRIGNMNHEHSSHENVAAAFSFANDHNTRRVHACLEGYDD